MKVEHALDKETILQQLEDVRAKQVDEWCSVVWYNDYCMIQVHSVPIHGVIDHIKNCSKVLVRILDWHNAETIPSHDYRIVNQPWAERLVLSGWGTFTLDELCDIVNYCIRSSNLKAFL